MAFKEPKTARGQWGADRHANPMPIVPRSAGDWTMALGRAALVVTVAAWLGLVMTLVDSQLLGSGPGRASALQTIAFLTVVSLLAASATAYLVGRLGFYYRARRHRRIPRAVLDEFFRTTTPSLTAIVPSYQEEPGVIWMTLLSTALQEYPDLRVVLLIDDPPDPQLAKPYELLKAAHELPGQIQQLLSAPRRRFEHALALHQTTYGPDRPVTAEQVLGLAEHYEHAARWVQALIDGFHPDDHNERFFATNVLGQLGADLALTEAALRGAAADDPSKLPAERLSELHERPTPAMG